MTSFTLVLEDGVGGYISGIGTLDVGDRPDGGQSSVSEISADIMFTVEDMATLGEGSYYIRVDSADEGWDSVLGFQLHDWWIVSGGGLPPMRQRHRNDGLTTDTRQERRQISVSPLLVPTLWWVGAAGSLPLDFGD